MCVCVERERARERERVDLVSSRPPHVLGKKLLIRINLCPKL